jgi:hypothetical protein
LFVGEHGVCRIGDANKLGRGVAPFRFQSGRSGRSRREGFWAMTTLAANDHGYDRRRWAISALIVLLVHAGIGAAIVTWREVIQRAEPPRPIVIDLAPPLAPAPRQTELPGAPGRITPDVAPDVAPDKPTEKIEERSGAKSTAKGEEKLEMTTPVEGLPRATIAPPPNAEGENKADTKSATGGGTPGQANRTFTEPIDTRIAEQHRLRFNRAAKAKDDWKKAIMGRPSNMARPLKDFAGRQRPPGPGAPGGIARTAIGMPAQDAAGAIAAKGIQEERHLQPNSPAGATRNAVGAPAGVVRNAVGVPAAHAVNGPTTNAIGVSAMNRSSVGAPNIGRQNSGPVSPANGATNHSIISGTGLGRRGSGPGVVGGPAKNVVGISGTSIRPKQ